MTPVATVVAEGNALITGLTSGTTPRSSGHLRVGDCAVSRNNCSNISCAGSKHRSCAQQWHIEPPRSASGQTSYLQSHHGLAGAGSHYSYVWRGRKRLHTARCGATRCNHCGYYLVNNTLTGRAADRPKRRLLRCHVDR
jgi:hypothetical protein